MVRDAEGNGVDISMSRVGADMLSDGLAAHLNRPLEKGPAEWACTVADAWAELAHNKKTRDDLIKVIPQRLIVALDLLQQSTRANPLRKVLPK
jgi:hypothetical protein